MSAWFAELTTKSSHNTTTPFLDFYFFSTNEPIPSSSLAFKNERKRNERNGKERKGKETKMNR
eukprot:m.53917 g.53917  ORF g.53917 m.53917 type:complete len:63 (-) comp12828_c0_seq1:868-1056(-)